MTNSDGKQVEIPESEKMLAEIAKAKEALASKAESTPASEVTPAQNTPEKATPEKAPEPTAKTEAAPDKSGQAVSQQETPADKKADKSAVDAMEWAKRKGLTSADAMARSLRELEQKLGRTTAELKAAREQVPQTPPGYQPQPQWQPQWTPPPQQFYPQPPTYPVDRERLLEIEAAKRGWDKEDFRKIVELTDEMSELKIRRIKAESDARYTALERETRRNSELNALLADPFFTNPKVQFEMHKVFEENPQAFSLEPQPYVYAFNEAQKRLGRQFLQDGPMESEHVPSLPTKPPVDPGKASTPAFEQSKESKILEEFNNAKSADEQKQILSRLGRVPTI